MIKVIKTVEGSYSADRVSLVTMTRKRPAEFFGLIRSLGESLANPEMTDVWCYVDDDDETAGPLIQSLQADSGPLRVNWVIGPRPVTLGECVNVCTRLAKETSGILLGTGEDYRLHTHHWDDCLRHVYNNLKDRTYLGHLLDPLAPNNITAFSLSREWVDALGYFVPEHFPFWYGDVWLDDICRMTGRLTVLPIDMRPLAGKGKTSRMWNTPFWERFFREAAVMRFADACRLLQSVGDVDAHSRLANAADQTIQDLKKRGTHSWEALCRMELGLTNERSRPSRIYFEAEARACARLAQLQRDAPRHVSPGPQRQFSVDAVMANIDACPPIEFQVQVEVVREALAGEALGVISETRGVSPQQIIEWRNAYILGFLQPKPAA